MKFNFLFKKNKEEDEENVDKKGFGFLIYIYLLKKISRKYGLSQLTSHTRKHCTNVTKNSSQCM